MNNNYKIYQYIVPQEESESDSDDSDITMAEENESNSDIENESNSNIENESNSDIINHTSNNDIINMEENNITFNYNNMIQEMQNGNLFYNEISIQEFNDNNKNISRLVLEIPNTISFFNTNNELFTLDLYITKFDEIKDILLKIKELFNINTIENIDIYYEECMYQNKIFFVDIVDLNLLDVNILPNLKNIIINNGRQMNKNYPGFFFKKIALLIKKNPNKPFNTYINSGLNASDLYINNKKYNINYKKEVLPINEQIIYGFEI